jgi:hypothetical protein
VEAVVVRVPRKVIPQQLLSVFRSCLHGPMIRVRETWLNEAKQDSGAELNQGTREVFFHFLIRPPGALPAENRSVPIYLLSPKKRGTSAFKDILH